MVQFSILMDARVGLRCIGSKSDPLVKNQDQEMGGLMKVRYMGPTSFLELTNNRVYEVMSIEGDKA